MKNKLIVAMLAAVMALSLVACGSSTTETAATEAAVETEGTEAAETEAAETEAAGEETEGTEAAAEGEVSEAVADGVLTVGTNAEFPPFEFVGDDGEPDGFDIALIKAIGEKMGVEVEVENMEFASLVSSIGSKIDLAIAGMTVTEERQAMVDFSDSYYEAVQYVIVGADSEVATAEDLVGKNIGVQLGTTGDFIAEEIEGATVSQYNKAVDAVNDLINGRVDVVIIDKNPAQVFGERFGEDVKIIDGADFAFEAEEYAIAMPKGDAALVEAVNAALAEMQADGSFDALVAEYIEEN